LGNCILTARIDGICWMRQIIATGKHERSLRRYDERNVNKGRRD